MYIYLLIRTEQALASVEGGNYISPELKAGAVYDGTEDAHGEVILYQPVYICVPHKRIVMKAPSTPDVKHHQQQQSQQKQQTTNNNSCSTARQSSHSEQKEVSESKVSSL